MVTAAIDYTSRMPTVSCTDSPSSVLTITLVLPVPGAPQISSCSGSKECGKVDFAERAAPLALARSDLPAPLRHCQRSSHRPPAEHDLSKCRAHNRTDPRTTLP